MRSSRNRSHGSAFTFWKIPELSSSERPVAEEVQQRLPSVRGKPHDELLDLNQQVDKTTNQHLR